MPNKKRKSVRITKSTDLHVLGRWAEEWSFIPQGKLGQAIDNFPKLKEQIDALERLGCAFLKTVEVFRRLEIRYWSHDDGNVYIPLFPMLELLGIVLPTEVGQIFDETVCEFVAKYDVMPESIVWQREGHCFVPSIMTPRLIRAAQFPFEIEQRLLVWFEAYIAERELAAPWHVQCADEIME